MSLKTNCFYDFIGFRLDLAEKILRRGEKTIPITPKVYETLCVLVGNAGRLIEKDELMRQIWHERFVEESNLTFNIKMLRKALGDDAGNPTFIETVPRRGYRFIAPVEEVAVETSPPPASLTATENLTANPFKTVSPQVEISPLTVAETKKSFRSRFVSLPAAILMILFVSAITVVSWYAVGSGTGSDAPVLTAPFNAEKLSTTGKVWLAVVSPDGKNVIYRNETGNKQSIWLKQLDLENSVELIASSEDIYYGLAFSPNADFIYFSRRARYADGQADIYRVPIFGGVPSRIVSETQGWLSVSPDGGTISFVRCYYRDDEFCSLWIADAASGQNQRRLAARPRPFRISDNQISPDGRTVAFAVGQSENQGNDFALREVNIADGTERELSSQRFFNIQSLAWLPNQSDLIIAASRVPTRNFRLWQISVKTDSATPLTKDSEAYMALSLDRAARKISAIQVKPDFSLTIYDRENPSHGRTLTNASTGKFAPNGALLFSFSMANNQEIWTVNADGSGQKQLTNNPADDSEPIASPDGRSIFFCSNRTGAAHVWRMNADGTDQFQITRTDGGLPIFVSSDGRWIYYQHGIDRTLWRVSADGGGEQLVLDKRKNVFAISPDASQIAYQEKQGVQRVLIIASLADGQVSKTYSAPTVGTRITAIEWLPDGKNVAYVLSDGTPENTTLWIQTLDDKTPQPLADIRSEEVSSLAFAPDGKTFAVVQGKWKHDAVLLKGLK